MAQIQLAMMGKLPYTVLREAVFAHPDAGRIPQQLVLPLSRLNSLFAAEAGWRRHLNIHPRDSGQPR